MARYPDTVTSTWSPARLGDMTGKRVIVTGATNGVGLGTARALAKAGAHVIVAVRNTELGAQRAAEIGGSTTVSKLDLADLSSVRAFADRLDDDVDILVNNAGALAEKRSDTVDGFEITIGTNLLGPFALTNLLFERVRSQIINVGSDAHKSATLRLDDMHLRTHKWTALGAYARSKLAVMLWGLELDRRLRAAHSPVVTHLTHPGFVASNLSHVSDRPLMAVAHRAIKGGGRLGRERHRRRGSAHAVLHHRAHPARQLCRRRRRVRLSRSTRSDRPVRCSVRLRGGRGSLQVRRARDRHRASGLVRDTQASAATRRYESQV